MKRKPKKFGPRLTVSLTAGDYDALNALAQKDEVSVSWVVRRAVERYLHGFVMYGRPRCCKGKTDLNWR